MIRIYKTGTKPTLRSVLLSHTFARHISTRGTSTSSTNNRGDRRPISTPWRFLNGGMLDHAARPRRPAPVAHAFVQHRALLGNFVVGVQAPRACSDWVPTGAAPGLTCKRPGIRGESVWEIPCGPGIVLSRLGAAAARTRRQSLTGQNSSSSTSFGHIDRLWIEASGWYGWAGHPNTRSCAVVVSRRGALQPQAG